MKNNVLDYVNYFRQIAIAHKDIKHIAAAEDNNGGLGECKFVRWNTEEIVTGLRSSIGFPALALEMYEVATEANSIYDVKGNFKGAFSILIKANPNRYDEQIEALAQAETILMQCLQKIWADHYGIDAERQQTPFQYFDFEGIQIMSFGPTYDNIYGWRAEFNFNTRLINKIASQPAPGTFI